MQPTAAPAAATAPLPALMQVMTMGWLSRALYAAVTLGVADALEEGAAGEGMSCDALADKVGLHRGTLYRLMRALAANQIFVELPPRRFAHSERSRLLRRDVPNSCAALVELNGMPLHQAAWDQLGAAVGDGRAAFVHAHGRDLYDVLGSDAATAQVFDAAMVAMSVPEAAAIVAALPELAQMRQVLDVAGGRGHLLAALLAHHPRLHGAVFDLPHMRAPCAAHLATCAAAARAGFVAGSFLEALPAGYDAYLVKNALWNWSDADVGRIMRAARAAIGGGGGRLWVVERLLEPGAAANASLYDLQMLVMPGGRVRSGAEYAALAGEQGLRQARRVAAGPQHVLEFVPA